MKDPATIALCVGHSRHINGRRDGGAVAADGKTFEWEYNSDLADRIATILAQDHGLSAVIVDDYQGTGYTPAMKWLAGKLRSFGNIKLAVELHFNAANGTARGHEWLHWSTSTKGKRLATELHLAFAAEFSQAEFPARGVKRLTGADRGAEFVKLTHCPAVICEPFFGDNPQDWKMAASHRASIATAIAAGIANAHRAI